MAVDETPLWNRLVATARDAPVVENGVFVTSSNIAEPLTALVLRKARIARETRRRERWLWRVEWLALAASLLATMFVDWTMVLPNDDCPLLTAQLISEELVP